MVRSLKITYIQRQYFIYRYLKNNNNDKHLLHTIKIETITKTKFLLPLFKIKRQTEIVPGETGRLVAII